MSDVGLLLTLIAAGVLTFLIRFSFIGAGRYLPRSQGLQTVLRYVPAAVLAALVAPELLVRDGSLTLDAGNLRLWAGLCAIVIALWSRSVIATIAGGMGVLWGLQWLLG